MKKRDLIYIGTIGLLIVLFIFREGCNGANTTQLIDDIANYSDTAKYYEGLNDANIAYNQSLELENDKQLQSVLSKYDTLSQVLNKFKDIKSTTIIRERIVIQRDTIPFETRIPCDFEPFQVRRDSIYYQFLGTIGNDFFSIDSLVIPNTQSIVVGTKKLGFLKGKEKRVEVINSNPLMQVTNIGSYTISDKKKWYETRAFSFAVGIAAGIVAVETTKK